jgi:hypothetical protein
MGATVPKVKGAAISAPCGRGRGSDDAAGPLLRMFMREFLVEVKVFNMGERHLPRIGAEKTDVFF